MFRVIHGDCREALKEIPSRAVQVCVTSPPYYGLRAYKGVEPTTWGGDPGHVHAWQRERVYKDSPTRVGGEGIGFDNAATTRQQRWTESATCSCGAWRGCLGNEPDVGSYVAHVVECLSEVRRVLRDDGTCWLVLGDSYGRGKRPAWEGDARRGVNRRKAWVGYAEGAAQDESQDGQLLGVPWRVAFALQADGWLLRSDVVWAKTATMPESVGGWRFERHRVKVSSKDMDAMPAQKSDVAHATSQKGLAGHSGGAGVYIPAATWADCPGCSQCTPNDGLVLRRGSWRCTRAHEFCFMLAKQGGYLCDAEAVTESAVEPERERADRFGGASWEGRQQHSEGGLSLGHATRNPRDVWMLSPEPLTGFDHYAAFPSELARRCLAASVPARGVCVTCGAPYARIVERSAMVLAPSAAGAKFRSGEDGEIAHGRTATRGTMVEPPRSRTLGWRRTCAHADAPTRHALVIDPFCGSGTTGIVATRLGADFIGIDASAEYCEMARERIRADAPKKRPRSPKKPKPQPNPWALKARQGHPLHRICAFQASFPPQLPAYFLNAYAVEPGTVVLDPFSGRGTTLLEAALRGCTAYGADLLRTAVLLSRVKLRCPSRAQVLAEIAALRLDKPAPKLPQEFRAIYHPRTWRQLWNLRNARRSDALTALALGRLHGHSPGFFSATTFNVVSIPPAGFARQNAKHGSGPKPRDVREVLVRAACRFLPESPLAGEGEVFETSAATLPLEDDSVDLIITSPPFLDVVDYPDVNWLREWFLGGAGYNSSSKRGNGAANAPLYTHRPADYVEFLRSVFAELARVLRPEGTCVMEVGNVRRQQNMAELALAAARGHLDQIDFVSNDFAGRHVPKISRAMVGGRETATTQNQCVVLRRPR